MIPQTIHHVWLKNELPERYRIWIEGAKKLNPGYEFVFWDDEKIKTLGIPDSILQRGEEDRGGVVYLSDIVRFKILYEHGGWYFDPDIKHFQPLDSLRMNGGEVTFIVPFVHTERSFGIRRPIYRFDVNTMASAKWHPIPYVMYEEMIKRDIGKSGVLFSQVVETHMDEFTYIVNPRVMISDNPLLPDERTITFHAAARSWGGSALSEAPNLCLNGTGRAVVKDGRFFFV